MKELTADEYTLIEQYVNKAYLIGNEKSGSRFHEVAPSELFDNYKNQ